VPVAAALYCRISRDADRRGLGVARQEQDLLALAERKGWDVQGTYVDNDISAARKAGVTADRPRYTAMLDAIRAGRVQAVAVWDQDRLVRDPMELEQFLVLCEVAGLHHLSTVSDEWDIGSGEGIMVARIKAAVAAEEVRKLTKRIRRKHLQLAEGGELSGGGYRPFGYEADRLTIRPDEAALIRDAAARALAGDSIRSIVDEWRRAGVETVTGAAWSSTTVRRLLSSGRISGQREHHGEIVAEAVWPAIITPAQTARLRRILSDPARFVGGGVVARSYLLTGLMVCGRPECGAVMTTRPVVRKGHRYRRYCCTVDRGGCDRCGISAELAEEEVALLLVDNFEAGSVGRRRAAQGHSDEVSTLSAERAADVESLEELTHQRFVARSVDQASYSSARDALARRIAHADRRLDQLRRTDELAPYATPGALAAAWEGLSFDRRRSILTATIDRITVAPTTRAGNKFDPDRLTVEWKT
jgi:site-specific DNA recombinase